MKKKIICMGIISLFLLTGIASVSAFTLKETGTKSNQSFMVALAEYDAEKSLNGQISFEITVSDFNNGDPISFCEYEVYTRPFEKDVSYQRYGDKILGEFTATREGIYSLIVEITGENNDVEKTNFYYFINPSGTGKVSYYFRDVAPTHGQPGYLFEDGDHMDAKAMLLAKEENKPTEEEYWCCSKWIQTSPDEMPENISMFTLLTDIDIYCWYRLIISDYGRIGIQRYATYDTSVSRCKYVEGEPDVYNWINVKFSNLAWVMKSPGSWYWISLKLVGRDPYWMTKPEQPSYADFTYLYCKTPNIKSNSNLDVIILSATSSADDINNAEIILEGAGTTNLVVQMPNTELTYSAKLNGVECSFTQLNGELNFNLNLDSQHSEHTFHICHSNERINNKQSTNLPLPQFIEKLVGWFPLLTQLLNLQ